MLFFWDSCLSLTLSHSLDILSISTYISSFFFVFFKSSFNDGPLVDFMIMWNISIDVYNEKFPIWIHRLTIVMKMGFTWYFFRLFSTSYSLCFGALSLCVCASFFLFSHHSFSSNSTREIDIFHFGWRCIYQVHSLFFIWGRFIDWLFNDFPHWTSIASIALDRFLWWIYAHSQCDGAVVRHINRNALVVFHFYGNEDEIDNKLWQWPWQR